MGALSWLSYGATSRAQERLACSLTGLGARALMRATDPMSLFLQL